MTHPSIVVVGSLMMDLVMRVPRRPGPGETVFGTEFGMFLGGKGFNQAVAAQRMGGAVRMIGRVGDDHFGGLSRRCWRNGRTLHPLPLSSLKH